MNFSNVAVVSIVESFDHVLVKQVEDDIIVASSHDSFEYGARIVVTVVVVRGHVERAELVDKDAEPAKHCKTLASRRQQNALFAIR